MPFVVQPKKQERSEKRENVRAAKQKLTKTNNSKYGRTEESESERESEVAQSCPTLSDPMDCNLPGSSVHGIFQARVLEWGAIAISKRLY